MTPERIVELRGSINSPNSCAADKVVNECLDAIAAFIIERNNWRAIAEMNTKTLNSECESLHTLVSKLVEALQWCGGSDDFGPNGKARKGWLKAWDLVLEAKKVLK